MAKSIKYELLYNGAILGGVQPRGPTGVEYAFGSFWIAQINNGILSIRRLSENNGQSVAAYDAAQAPWGVQQGFPLMGSNAQYVYAYNQAFDGIFKDLYVWRIDPATFPAGASVVTSAPLGVIGFGFGWHNGTTPDGQVWITPSIGVTRFNLATMAIVATVPGTASSYGANCYDSINGFIWAVNFTNTIWKIDPATNTVVDTLIQAAPPGVTFQDICYAFGSLWAVDTGTGIYRYNPATKALQAFIAGQGGASSITIDYDTTTLAVTINAVTEQVAIIDPYTNTYYQNGAFGPRVIPYPTGASGIAAIRGNKGRTGFVTGNQNFFNPAWAFMDTIRSSKKHRGGELWGIIPELANYLSS